MIVEKKRKYSTKKHKHDDQIIEWLKSGDQTLINKGIELIWKLNFLKMKKTCLKKYGSHLYEVADELIVDAIYKAIEHIQKPDFILFKREKGTLEGLFFKHLHWKMDNAWRIKQKEEAILERDYSFDWMTDEVEEENEVLKQRKQLLYEKMEELPEQKKKIIQFMIDGTAIEEIQKELGIKKKKVYGLNTRAKNALRKMMVPKPEPESEIKIEPESKLKKPKFKKRKKEEAIRLLDVRSRAIYKHHVKKNDYRLMMEKYKISETNYWSILKRAKERISVLLDGIEPDIDEKLRMPPKYILLESMDKLDVKSKRLINLILVNKMKVKLIAERYDIKEITMFARILKAKHKLLDQMIEDAPEHFPDHWMGYNFIDKK